MYKRQVHKVFANASEYYSIEASVKKEEALASVKSAVDSFKILGNSSLKEAAPGTAAPAGNAENKDAAGADAAGNDAAANTGNTADTGAADTGNTDAGTADTGSVSEEGGETSSEGTTNSAGFTDEQLSNTCLLYTSLCDDRNFK